MSRTSPQPWFIIGLFVAGLAAFSYQLYDRYTLLKLFGLTLALGAVLVRFPERKLKVNRIAGILLVLALFELISTFWSYSETNSIKHSFLTIMSALVFILFSQEGLKKNANTLITINALVLTVFIAVAIFNIFTQGWEPYGIHSLSANKNLFSGYLLLSLPVSFISLKRSENGAFRILMKCILIFALFLILILQSRSVYLSTILFGLLAGFFVLLEIYNQHNKPLINYVKKYSSIPIFVLLGYLIYISVINPDVREDFIDKINVTNYFSDIDQDKITEVTENNYQSIEIRKILWRSSAKLVADKPILGFGKGNWSIAVGKYATPHLPDRINENRSYSHLHNDFLQQLVETGIIGLLLFLIPILALFYTGYKSAFAGGPKFEVIIITIFLFRFSVSECRTPFSFLFSIAATLSISGRGKQLESKNLLSIRKNFLLGLLILACLISAIQIRSDYHSLKSIRYEAKGDYRKVLSHISKADNLTYNITPTNFPLDYIAGRTYINMGDYQKAFPLVESALDINPFEVRILNDYGMLLSYRGKRDSALSAFESASSLAPYFDDPKFNMCAIYFSEGRYDMALKMLATVSESKKKDDYLMQIFEAMKAD